MPSFNNIKSCLLFRLGPRVLVDGDGANNTINMKRSTHLLSILARRFPFSPFSRCETSTRRICLSTNVRVFFPISLSFSSSLVQWSSTCSDAREEIEDRASLTLRQSQWHHANCKYLIQMTCSEMTTERSLPVSTTTRTTWAKQRRNLYAKKEWDYFSFSSIRTTTTAMTRTTTARTIASASSSTLIRVHSTTGRGERERGRVCVVC